MTWKQGMLLALALTAGLSCDNDRDITRPPPPSPLPGRLSVLFTTPRSDDGAIVFEIRGHAAGTPVLTDTTMWMFTEHMTATLIRVVLVGDLTSGPLMTFDVFDVHQPYTATIVQVSDRGSAVRAYLQDYQLTISR